MWRTIDVNTVVIVGSAILFVLVFGFIALAFVQRTHNGIKQINNKLRYIQNVVAVLGILFTVLAIGITGAINKHYETRSNLEVVIVDGRLVEWGLERQYETLLSVSEKENGLKPLPYTYDEDGCFCYLNRGPEFWWKVQIVNSGNTTAKNVIVEVSIDHYSFLSQNSIDDYILKDYYYATGQFRCITRSYDNIQPNTSITLPDIPLFTVQERFWPDSSYERGEPTNLHVTIYEDNEIQKTFTFQCQYYDDENDFSYRHCAYDYIKEMQAFEQEKNLFREDVLEDNNLFLTPVFSYTDCKKILKDYPTMTTSEYKNAYMFFLSKLDAYNPNEKRNAHINCIFYGRMYYLSLNEDDIESKISNDIFTYTGIATLQ